MQPHTLLLVSSSQSHTAALRAALTTWRAARVIGDVHHGEEAVAAATRLRPDAILLDADLPSHLLVDLVRDLRAASDASRLVVIGALAALDGDIVGLLLDLGIAACVLWSDVHPEALPRHVATVLDGEALVISRGLLERRQGPRVAGLILTARERATPHGGAADGGAPGGARVTLWLDDPEIADSLRFYAADVGLRLDVVDTAEALRAALPRSDALVVDCTTLAGALERCQTIVPHTALPVLICHPDEGFVDDLRPGAGGELTWLPPAWLGTRLRDKLRLLVALPASAAGGESDVPPPPRLTERQRAVLTLAEDGHSNRAIAARLGLSTNTVKTHIANARRKGGDDEREGPDAGKDEGGEGEGLTPIEASRRPRGTTRQTPASKRVRKNHPVG